MKRILLVEDDLSLINGLSFAVKKQGYDLALARTSCEASAIWEDGKYDLVVLDVSLPDGSGFAICKKIRQTSKVPIIFLTAADEETDIIMEERQITKMITAEAFTYAVSGCAVGCIIGLLVSKQLYDYFIAARFRYATWNIPVVPLVIILLFVVAAAVAAVYAPAKRIRNMAVTDTINEL